MASSHIDRAEKKRAWRKCSACRKGKVKCCPTVRDWQRTKEKCEYCILHELSCGPSYTKNEDPGIGKLGNSSVAQRAAGTIGDHNTCKPVTLATDEGLSKLSAASRTRISQTGDVVSIERVIIPEDELGEKARAKLSELNAFGTILLQQPPSAKSVCQTFNPAGSSDFASVNERLHLLFVEIYRLGSQASEAGRPDQARWIIYALMSALDRYVVLHHDRRRDVLSRIALMFQEYDHQWEYEHVLEIMSNIAITESAVVKTDPCIALANSLSVTSEMTKRVQENLWRETAVMDEVPEGLKICEIHRAARLANGAVITAILAQNHDIDTAVDLDDPQRLRVEKFWLHSPVRSRLGVDTRDRCYRTPLFLAAAQGHYSNSLSLITALADPNSCDKHGHTVLEVACRGGHLEVAELLVGVGADVNPQLAWCASSPLQAAIESERFDNRLVKFLLDRGASLNVRRLADSKTAVDVAADRGLGLGEREEYMQSKLTENPRFGFTCGDISDGMFNQARNLGD